MLVNTEHPALTTAPSGHSGSRCLLWVLQGYKTVCRTSGQTDWCCEITFQMLNRTTSINNPPVLCPQIFHKEQTNRIYLFLPSPFWGIHSNAPLSGITKCPLSHQEWDRKPSFVMWLFKNHQPGMYGHAGSQACSLLSSHKDRRLIKGI